MAHETDTLTDLQDPDLTRRLAEYLGALRLRALGSVSDRFVDEKLQALQLACRAADRLLAVFANPEQGLAAVATRMHQRLTAPQRN